MNACKIYLTICYFMTYQLSYAMEDDNLFLTILNDNTANAIIGNPHKKQRIEEVEFHFDEAYNPFAFLDDQKSQRNDDYIMVGDTLMPRKTASLLKTYTVHAANNNSINNNNSDLQILEIEVSLHQDNNEPNPENDGKVACTFPGCTIRLLKDNLPRHMRLHYGQYFECPISVCKAHIDRKERMKDHYLKKHPEITLTEEVLRALKPYFENHPSPPPAKTKSVPWAKKIVACPECGLEMQQEHLLRHKQDIHEGRYYVCLCNKIFSRTEPLKNHIDKYKKDQNDHIHKDIAITAAFLETCKRIGPKKSGHPAAPAEGQTPAEIIKKARKRTAPKGSKPQATAAIIEKEDPTHTQDKSIVMLKCFEKFEQE